MKKCLFILCIIFSSVLNVTAGDRWSISLSNSPRFEHRYAGEKNLYYYSFSPGFAADYRISDHLSVAGRLTFHHAKSLYEPIVYGLPLGYYIDLRNSLLEIPVQVNYHLLGGSHRLDPYFKAGIRYTYDHLTSVMTSFEGTETTYDNDSYFLADAGVGAYFRIKDNFSAIGEISYGIGINHFYSDFRYVETLIGLRYTFKSR
jgi:hypothetical protein